MSGSSNQLLGWPYASAAATPDDGTFPAYRPPSQMTAPGGNYEALPGITSGAPPKPWGLDHQQLMQMLELQRQRSSAAWQQAQDQLIQQKWANTYLGHVLPPADYGVDPGMMINRLLGAPSVPSNIRMPEVTWPRWEAPPGYRDT